MGDSKPIIFQFSFGESYMQDTVDYKGTFPPNFGSTLKKVDEMATVKVAWTAEEASDLLKRNPAPYAILITDDGITESENRELSFQVIEYVRNGGTAILCLCFGREVLNEDFNSFMKDWDLPWKVHAYLWYDCVVNDSAVGLHGKQWMYGLPALYRSQSLFLGNVAPESCWYLPAPRIQEHDDDKRRKTATLIRETPIAFTQVGEGYLGYTGDGNQHKATDAIMFAMLGMNQDVWWCTCGHEKK
ncbi:hypothetical protein F4677DRAFT_444487 [Hypoxylon crocopeplum]|nr:hypothetical protein F4677DRAFT_444487 [Hypoxylon crocopeplum]